MYKYKKGTSPPPTQRAKLYTIGRNQIHGTASNKSNITITTCKIANEHLGRVTR